MTQTQKKNLITAAAAMAALEMERDEFYRFMRGRGRQLIETVVKPGGAQRYYVEQDVLKFAQERANFESSYSIRDF